MKVCLALSSGGSVPFPESCVKSEDVRDGERLVYMNSVAFAEEVDDSVELRINGYGEFVVEDASLRATYNM